MSQSAWKTSSLVESFEESATLAIGGRAKQLAAEGRSIVNFGGGEPDFNTPSAVIDRAFESAKKGNTKYTPVPGVMSLRKAIAKRMTEDYGVGFKAEEIMVSSGGKQAIYHFLQAVLEPGDEVLVLAPYWVSFPDMVKLVGAKPVIVTARGDRLTAEDIEAKRTSKTRMLIYNNPSNPAGTVFSDTETRSFMKVIEPHPIWLLSDDTYYKLVYAPAKWVSPLTLLPQLKDRSCVVGSASKSYAMTGWRLGWAAAPTSVVSAMVKLQGQVTSSACSISQAAAEVAMTEFDGNSEEFRAEFEKRKNFMLAELKKIPGIKVVPPEGAFYVFVDFSDVLKGMSVEDYAKNLLEKHGVCIIPGTPFGAPGFGRLSYALSTPQIEEGIRRLAESLKSL